MAREIGIDISGTISDDEIFKLKEMQKSQKQIFALQKKIQQLEKSNTNLYEKNVDLSENKDYSSSSNAYYDIVMYAMESLNRITKSPLTKELINNPVLTPSLHIVDKGDTFKILDKNKNHPFLKKNNPIKGKTYAQFKEVVTLRKDLKSMIEKQNNSGNEYESSPNNQKDQNNTDSLIKKIDTLEKRVCERNSEIKGIKKINKDLLSEIKGIRA